MNESESDIVPQKRSGVTVAASPFNGVKLELVVTILALIITWLVVDRLVDGILLQLLVLGGAGVLFMFVLMFRVRQVVKKSSAMPIEDVHGKK